MGLNKIALSTNLIEELYQSSLIEKPDRALKNKIVVPETTNEQLVKQTAVELKSLGNNNSNILILVRSAEAVYLPDDELKFLTDILSACKLSLADIAIVNLANHSDATYKEITKLFSSKIVILFDIEPSSFGLPMSFPYYQIQPFANNSFLYSPSLKDLENDKVEKSKLWVCLKRLFNL